MTKCQKQHHDAYKNALLRDGKFVPPPGAFVPNCEKDGSYSQLQCWGSTGFCWCVDEKGDKIEGTEAREEVDCSKGIIHMLSDSISLFYKKMVRLDFDFGCLTKDIFSYKILAIQTSWHSLTLQ